MSYYALVERGENAKCTGGERKSGMRRMHAAGCISGKEEALFYFLTGDSVNLIVFLNKDLTVAEEFG